MHGKLHLGRSRRIGSRPRHAVRNRTATRRVERAVVSHYVVNKLVADRPNHGAAVVDPKLVNPWGLSAGPDSPLWVSDNGTDVSTVYTRRNERRRDVERADRSARQAAHRPVRCSTARARSRSPAHRPPSSSPASTATSRPGTAAPTRQDGAHEERRLQGPRTRQRIRSPRLLAANFHANRIDVFNGKFKLLHDAEPVPRPETAEAITRRSTWP